MAGSKQNKSLSLVSMYLVLYNTACMAGWAMVLNSCVRHIASNSTELLWEDCNFILKIVQTAAVMEIVHSMVGFVRSPVFTTFLQVFSRVWVLWAVMFIAPPAQTHFFTVLCITSWACVEVPRYLFYALNLLGEVPYPIFWLRYSLFAILYPTGITGELGCTYLAAKYLYETKLYTFAPIATMPDVQISLLMFLVLAALTYIPGRSLYLNRPYVSLGAPKMYFYMVHTRKKQFKERTAGGKDDAAPKKKSGKKE